MKVPKNVEPEKFYRVEATPNGSSMAFKRFTGRGSYGQLGYWTPIEDNNYWSTKSKEEAEAVCTIVGGSVHEFQYYSDSRS